MRDHEDGLMVKATSYTVADAVRDCLAFGLTSLSVGTVVATRDVVDSARRVSA
jgi:hypothetical protein